MGSNGLQWAPVQGLATDPCLIDHRTDGRSMRWKARTDGRPMPTRRNAAVNRWLEGGGAAPATPPESSSASSAVARVIALPQALHSRAITHLQPTQEPGIACSRADGDDGWEPFDDAQLAKGIAAAAGWMDMAADPSLEIVGLSDEGWEEMACFEIVSDATDYVNVHATVSRSAGAVRDRILQAQAQFGLTPAGLCDLEQDANRRSAQRASENQSGLEASVMAVAPTPQCMSEAEIREAVQAEGLTLVPSSVNQSGFKGVYVSGSRFNANLTLNGKSHHLGRFNTALEAALHVARFLGPDASAAAAAATASATAASEAAEAKPQGMSEAEVWAAVKAEGLTLEPSSVNQSGFKGVYVSGSRFQAHLTLNGKAKSLGSFVTALEAALHVARFLGPDTSAAVAVVAAAATPVLLISEAEIREAVEAEGLTLVPSSNNQSGFKGVVASGSRFHASCWHNGKSHSLGRFLTALEAALHVARFLGPGGSAATVAAAASATAVASTTQSMSEGEIREAVQAEGLTLVPSSAHNSGWKGVCASGKHFIAKLWLNGKQHYLGQISTALEAALHIARFLGPDASAAAAAAATAAAVAAEATGAPLQAISEAEVWAAVKAEGLALVPVSTSQSGFKGVAVSGSRFQANLYHKGKQHNLGRFDTALEAALVVARFLGADASAAAVASAPAAKPPARQVSVASKKRNLTQGGVVLVDAAGAPWYEVESLLATRQPARAVERDFLVRWRGHSPEEDSWEPESNIDDRLVQAFDSGHWAGAKAPRRVAAGASTSGAALPEADDATTSAHKRSMARMSHTEAAVAMAETHRAVATKAAMEAADEEGPGGGFARCCILGCTEQLLQCNGLKHAGCAVGRAESWHVLCAPCLGRWYTSQAGLRDEFGLLKQTRRTCPVCQAELRTTGSEMRGVAGQYAMGLQKVAGTWPVVQKKRRREAATAAAIGPDGNTDDDGVEAEEEGMFDAE